MAIKCARARGPGRTGPGFSVRGPGRARAALKKTAALYARLNDIDIFASNFIISKVIDVGFYGRLKNAVSIVYGFGENKLLVAVTCIKIFTSLVLKPIRSA